MPFKTYTDWLFDGNRKSPLPEPKFDESGKEIVPDILKSTSPISNLFMMKIFLNHGSLNFFLNTYLNNTGLFYIPKEEMMKFMKKIVCDFNANRRHQVYFKRTKKDEFVEIIKERFPLLTNEEISIIIAKMETEDKRNNILKMMGHKNDSKRKNRKAKKMIKINEEPQAEKDPYSLEKMMENFVLEDR